MIGKIIAGSSFGATVGYVMKEQSSILGFEGVEPLREVAEAMLTAAEERKRKLRQRKITNHSMGL